MFIWEPGVIGSLNSSRAVGRGDLAAIPTTYLLMWDLQASPTQIVSHADHLSLDEKVHGELLISG